MVSYGSGSGSDGFIFKVTDKLPKVQNMASHTRAQLENNKVYLDYGTYVKYRGKILKAE
jgi:hydroxymethylglutaryl-CoA synthase